MKTPTYRLRFFFDYGCGGCLWPDNDAAYEKYGTGTLDAETYALDGSLIEEAKIPLPPALKQKVLELDKRFSESLNWDDPAGASLWNDAQWNEFHAKTAALHREIANALGDDFEIVYKQ